VYDVYLIESDGNYSFDKTFAEITSAVKAGMIVRVIRDNEFFSSEESDTKNDTKAGTKANAMFFHLNFAASNGVQFSCLDGATNIIITLWRNDTVEISEITFSES
jgi:hypothetical protein